jgi:hypothetical protein
MAGYHMLGPKIYLQHYRPHSRPSVPSSSREREPRPRLKKLSAAAMHTITGSCRFRKANCWCRCRGPTRRMPIPGRRCRSMQLACMPCPPIRLCHPTRWGRPRLWPTTISITPACVVQWRGDTGAIQSCHRADDVAQGSSEGDDGRHSQSEYPHRAELRMPTLQSEDGLALADKSSLCKRCLM